MKIILPKTYWPHIFYNFRNMGNVHSSRCLKCKTLELQLEGFHVEEKDTDASISNITVDVLTHLNNNFRLSIHNIEHCGICKDFEKKLAEKESEFISLMG